MTIIIKNIFSRISLFILCIVLTQVVKAQEQLVPLSANLSLPVITSKNMNAAKTASVAASDTLPFFDDFSYAYQSPYPSVNHWKDSSVYVNVGFGTAPKSLGVATFDGLNKKGYPYWLTAPVSTSASADTLTSRPINLEKLGTHSYNFADSIYLSFYYQAMGNGDWPEPNDSLCVDFFKPNQNVWQEVWHKNGYHPTASDTNFRMVILPVNDTAYFDSIFQFRFRNRATTSGSLDHWNIDYVYLNKGRSNIDTVSQDVAFAYMPTPILKNYSKMPFSQYVSSELGTSFYNVLRNNDKNTSNITYYYDIYDHLNALQHSYSAVDNIQPFQNFGYQTGIAQANVSLGTYTLAPNVDSILKIKHHIKTSSSDFNKANDTLIQYQRFPKYYAYDDGTAEVGYYNNTYGAKMGVRYTLNNYDTLRGINIYFDPITQGGLIINSSFRLMVWSDGGGSPGSVIYRDSAVNHFYLQGNYDMMPTFKLTTCLPMNAGTYYFGIQQYTNQPLNIGFDKNTNHHDALFYDIGSGWTQSSIPGSIMINPTMGCYVPPTPIGIAEYEHQQIGFNLYPNPAQNTLTIRTSELSLDAMTLNIYSVLGQSVLTKPFNNAETIDISAFPDGVYFVYLNGSNKNTTPQKLIISR
jgi:hypothetical protein